MSNTEPIRNLGAMLVFVAVVDEDGFSAAARRLGMSKASVSREIAGLERRLGAQLLRRTTRRMSLTEVGEAFLERCRRVLDEAESAERVVSELQADPRGEIRLAAAMSFGHRCVAPLLPGFLERYPKVRIHLDLTDRIIDLVKERFDLSVRVGEPREPTLVRRRLAPLRLALCASPAYVARYGAPDTPDALKQHNCLGYTSPPERWTFGRRRIETRGDLNIDNGDGLLQAALAGHGIVYLPTFLVGPEIAAGRLLRLLPDEPVVEGGAYAVYPESRHLSPKVRALIDYLVEQFGSAPAWDAFLEERAA